MLPIVFSRMVAGSDVDVAFKDCGSKLVAIEKITVCEYVNFIRGKIKGKQGFWIFINKELEF